MVQGLRELRPELEHTIKYPTIDSGAILVPGTRHTFRTARRRVAMIVV